MFYRVSVSMPEQKRIHIYSEREGMAAKVVFDYLKLSVTTSDGSRPEVRYEEVEDDGTILFEEVRPAILK